MKKHIREDVQTAGIRRSLSAISPCAQTVPVYFGNCWGTRLPATSIIPVINAHLQVYHSFRMLQNLSAVSVRVMWIEISYMVSLESATSDLATRTYPFWYSNQYQDGIVLNKVRGCAVQYVRNFFIIISPG